MDLIGTLTSVVADLRAAGIRASLDARDVNPPGVWVTADQIEHNYVDGSATLRTRQYLIAPDTDAARAYRLLGDLLGDVLAAYAAHGTGPTDDTTMTAVQLPHGGGELPALRLTIDVPTRRTP